MEVLVSSRRKFLGTFEKTFGKRPKGTNYIKKVKGECPLPLHKLYSHGQHKKVISHRGLIVVAFSAYLLEKK